MPNSSFHAGYLRMWCCTSRMAQIEALPARNDLPSPHARSRHCRLNCRQRRCGTSQQRNPRFLLHRLNARNRVDVIEYAVSTTLMPCSCGGFADRGEVSLVPRRQSPCENRGCRSRGCRTQKNRESTRHCSRRRNILRPVADLADARNSHAVVYARRTAEADVMNLIKYAFVCPHEKHSFTSGSIFSIIKVNKKCKQFVIKIMQGGDKMQNSYAAGLGICLLLCACSQQKPIRLLLTRNCVHRQPKIKQSLCGMRERRLYSASMARQTARKQRFLLTIPTPAKRRKSALRTCRWEITLSSAFMKTRRAQAQTETVRQVTTRANETKITIGLKKHLQSAT